MSTMSVFNSISRVLALHDSPALVRCGWWMIETSRRGIIEKQKAIFSFEKYRIPYGGRGRGISKGRRCPRIPYVRSHRAKLFLLNRTKSFSPISIRFNVDWLKYINCASIVHTYYRIYLVDFRTYVSPTFKRKLTVSGTFDWPTTRKVSLAHRSLPMSESKVDFEHKSRPAAADSLYSTSHNSFGHWAKILSVD